MPYFTAFAGYNIQHAQTICYLMCTLAYFCILRIFSENHAQFWSFPLLNSEGTIIEAVVIESRLSITSFRLFSKTCLLLPSPIT